MTPHRLQPFDADQWHRVESVLQVALELEPERVGPHLDVACADDPDLRREVEALLAADAEAGAFLSVPVMLALRDDDEAVAAAPAPPLALDSADHPPDLPDPPPPPVLGRYAVEAELGRGGMGVVYRGRDLVNGRVVAIKSLPASLARDETRVARFLREAKLLASLHHPNIATIHGLERSPEGQRFLILERVDGETLQQRLATRRLALREALDIGHQIAAAMASAHAHGIVHRDLKPGNVMLTEQGWAKVLDFGLAKHLSRGDLRPGSSSGSAPTSVTATRDEVRLGTPGYMSPEQVLGLAQDARSDVFAFGCVLYECLTGEYAIPGSTLLMLFSSTLSAPVDFDRLPADVPATVREALERALEKDPEHRMSDLGEFVTSLASALGESRASVPSNTAVERSGLPAATTAFIGHERERDACVALLDRARLMTLTGPGGCGKTRLALEIARSRAATDRHVWFADLAPVADAHGLELAVETATDVRELPGVSLAEALALRLDGRPALLVLDNCEHLIGPCAAFATAALAACPSLRILATSREWLGVAGEQTIGVAPLPVPSADDAFALERIARSDAVRLFVDRAQLARHDFQLTAANAASVARICRDVDGIPLAIELAAAQLREDALEDIAGALGRRVRLDAGPDGGSRHGTLPSAIGLSYERLTAEECRMFRALATFTGGWSLESAAVVCGGSGDEFATLDMLTQLVDRSLVFVERARRVEPRYRFLEPIRQFATARLDETDEAAPLRARHLEHYLAYAESTATDLLGGPGQPDAMASIEAEHPNLLAALDACVWVDAAQSALRLAGAVWWFWYVQGHFALGRAALGRALSLPGADSPTPARALALCAEGGLAASQGDFVAGRRLNLEALALYQELGDRQGMGRALNLLGTSAGGEGRFAEARAYYEQAVEIFEGLGDERMQGAGLNNLSALERQCGDYTAMLAYSQRALDLGRRQRDPDRLTPRLVNLAVAAMRLGELERARASLAEALALVEELGARRIGTAALEATAELLGRMGRDEDAAWLAGAGRALRAAIGLPADDAWRRAQDDVIHRLGATLGEESCATLMNAGSAHPFERAIESARARLAQASDQARRAAPPDVSNSHDGFVS